MSILNYLKNLFSRDGTPTRDRGGFETTFGCTRVGPHTLTPPLGWSVHEIPRWPDGVAFQLIDPSTPLDDLPQIRLMRLPAMRRLDGAHISEILGTHGLDGGEEIVLDQPLQLMGRWKGFSFESGSSSPGDADVKSRGVCYSVSDSEGLLLFTSYYPRFQGIADAAFEEAHHSLIPFDSLDIFSNEAVEVSETTQRKILQAFEVSRRLYLRIWSWTAKKIAADTGRGVDSEVPCVEDEGGQRKFGFVDLALDGFRELSVDTSALEESGSPETFSVLAPLLPEHWPATVHANWKSGMRCELQAISWSRVELRVDKRLDREKLRSWSERWIEKRAPAIEVEDLVLGGVIHSLDSRASGEHWTDAVEVDLGSAPGVALWELLEVAEECGVTRAALGTWNTEGSLPRETIRVSDEDTPLLSRQKPENA